MRYAAALVMLCLFAPSAGVAQAPTEFVGTLEPLAVAGSTSSSVAIAPASEDARKALNGVVVSAEKVWAGELTFGAGKQPIYIIQAPGGRVAAATDCDRDGRIEVAERIPLGPDDPTGAPAAADSGFVGATLRLATPGAGFPDYPVRIRLRSSAIEPAPPSPGAKPSTVYLQASYQAFASGTVTVDGGPVRVKLIVNAKDFSVNPARSYQYVDCNADGEFDQDFTSWEMGYGRGTPPVFHIGTGDRYVSIKGVDVPRRTVTLAVRTAADYERIELRVGAVVPDFEFKALDGSAHRLAEFRGKYLLIDFWGTWCGPCVAEIPYLKKAYETYRARGFEILGMDNELPDVTPEDFAKGLEGVKKFVAEKGVTWTQAQTESIKHLYEVRFQIVAWPTAVLLDPDGRIVSIGRTDQGQPGLRGDQLDRTLAAILK